MHRFVVIMALFTCFCFVVGCDREVSALKLSTDLTKINDSLARYGKEWGDEFKRAYSTSDFSALQPIRVQMEVYVNRKIECVRNMEDVGGSRDFRKKEMEYLMFEKGLITNKLTRFENFNAQTPPEELAKAASELMSATEQEQFVLEQLHEEVRQYADRNRLESSSAY
jgi:hypothetical protein